MVEVRRSADCGNSPKNQFAEEYVIALLTGDISTLERSSSFNISAEQISSERLSRVQIDHVVTHGKVGAVNGTLGMSDGHSAGFCFVLVFASAKADRVAEITRYRS